jgi:hypothetical protein
MRSVTKATQIVLFRWISYQSAVRLTVLSAAPDFAESFANFISCLAAG